MVAEILLVEDNPGDVRLLVEAFKEGGFCGRLHVTHDGEEALAFLHHEGPFNGSPRPSLILLDLNLPRKDGREVLAQIKQEDSLRRIPVMILSTSTNADDIRRAYDLHANCYLPKPLNMDSLVQLGRLIENFWFEAAVLPV